MPKRRLGLEPRLITVELGSDPVDEATLRRRRRGLATGFDLSGQGRQPPYDAASPGVGIRKVDYQTVEIEITPPEGKRGKTRRLRMSEFNAWRLFGLLGLALGIKLSKEQSTIKL